MRIAWVSARDYDRLEGGAEQADLAMMACCPETVEIVPPGFNPHQLLAQYDKVVISTLRGLSANELGVLALTKPAIWAHDMEFEGHWLYGKARPFIALTPDHLARETQLMNIPSAVINPGTFDTTGLEPGKAKAEIAVWAARNIWHKGLDRAKAWSKQTEIPLYVHQDVPRDTIIAGMKMSRYFVLLSHIFDPGPWTVMEAQLCGCELVLDNVGHFREEPMVLRARINNAGKMFWEDVLS